MALVAEQRPAMLIALSQGGPVKKLNYCFGFLFVLQVVPEMTEILKKK
jgi:hypothetical protein